jgi:hypothetical protein
MATHPVSAQESRNKVRVTRRSSSGAACGEMLAAPYRIQSDAAQSAAFRRLRRAVLRTALPLAGSFPR